MSGSFNRAAVLWLLSICKDLERAVDDLNPEQASSHIFMSIKNKAVLTIYFDRLQAQGVTYPVLLSSSCRLFWFSACFSFVWHVYSPCWKAPTPRSR
uniref:Putative secreted protein n=1 Tax=Ixodes ricinus TaxID=34613 RepID=A0A6B0UDQ0_IXORI